MSEFNVYNITTWTSISLILQLSNIFGTFYICYKCNLYKKMGVPDKMLLMANLLVRGIALVEVLFFLNLHACILKSTYSICISIDSLPSILNLISHITKSIFFLIVLCFTSNWLDLKKAMYTDRA